MPLDDIVQFEGEGLSGVGYLPAGAQVADYLVRIHGVELDNLTVKLGIGNDAGEGRRAQRVPVLGVGIGPHIDMVAIFFLLTGNRRGYRRWSGRRYRRIGVLPRSMAFNPPPDTGRT